MMANLQAVFAASTVSLLLLLNIEARSLNGLTTLPPPDVSSLIAPCKNIGSTFPPPNSFACYRTTTKQDGRLQSCEAAEIREGEISVVEQSENYTIMIVHTPGRLLNREYVDRLLCRWDVRCPDNQLIYWDMAEHFIEPQRSSPFFQKDVCVDYLKLYRDSGVERSCGFVDSYADLEPNNLRIEFRSNNDLKFPGFKLKIVCFNPDLQDIEGCSNSPQQKRLKQARHTKSIKSSKQQGLEPVLQLRLSTLRPRRTRQATQNLVQQTTIVSRDSTIRYASANLQITRSRSVTFSVNGILAFHTTTSLNGLVSYYSNRGQVELKGPGLLYLSGGVAYYTQYGVDSKFMPSSSQRESISRMLDAEELLVVKNDFIIEEEQATTKPPLDSSADNPVAIVTQQSATQSRGSFSASVIATAETSVNSCNAVVRAVSQSVLHLAELE